MLLGWLIALATLVVPMATVVAGRQDRAIPAPLSAQAPQSPGRIASSGLEHSGAGAFDQQPDNPSGHQHNHPGFDPQRR